MCSIYILFDSPAKVNLQKTNDLASVCCSEHNFSYLDKGKSEYKFN